MIDPISTGNVQVSMVAAVKPEKVPEKAASLDKEPAVKVQTVSKETLDKIPMIQLDTVDLSLPAQARLMQQQGLTINQIAVKLELDIMTITRYLGI